MSDKLINLLSRTRSYQMTPKDIEEQEIDFAYGNAHFENGRITLELVAKALPPLDPSQTPQEGMGR